MNLAEPKRRKKVAAVTIVRVIDADVRSSKQGPNKKAIKGAITQSNKAKKAAGAALYEVNSG